MRTVWCDCCNAYIRIRKNHKRDGDILEMAELKTHKDGRKERIIYGMVNEKTNEIIDMKIGL